MKPRYEFIAHPYKCEYGSSVNTEIRHTILDRDISLGEILDELTTFLRAAGYQIDENYHLDIVNKFGDDDA
jgi:hypothetical protein